MNASHPVPAVYPKGSDGGAGSKSEDGRSNHGDHKGHDEHGKDSKSEAPAPDRRMA